MKKLIGMAAGFMLIFVLLNAGCARVEKVVAREDTLTVPFESLGTLEIKEKAPYVSSKGLWWNGVELATLTFADTPSRADLYKESLRDKLAEVAKRKYGAQAVINVAYWPDPASKKFPEGYIYARGEMIRYASFPDETSQSGVTPATV